MKSTMYNLPLSRWARSVRERQEQQKAAEPETPAFDIYDLPPEERERWLASQRPTWQRAGRSGERPYLEEVSQTEGWYDQPEWVRTQMLRDLGYGVQQDEEKPDARRAALMGIAGR